MSYVNSSSSLAQVQAAYDDNASYDVERDPAKARAFITAARILVNRIPRETSTPQAQLRTAIDLINEQIKSATDWLAANDTAGSATNVNGPACKRLDFRNSRG
jgi:hypothetical protein